MKFLTNESRIFLSACLGSALRMAVACSVVAGVTMYGPASLRRLVAFPSFAYFTVVVTATDAALGDVIRGCFLALFASAQSLCPAVLVFWLVGQARFSYGTISLAVAAASVVVVVPKSIRWVGKRLALGQIVIVYVVGFNLGVHAERLMHPIQVAASVAMGASASLLSMLLPYPLLASLEVREKSEAAAEIAAARLGLYVKALTADDAAAAGGSISKASSLSSSATKLLPIIKRYQESAQWERLPFKTYHMNSNERLQSLELPLRGMKMAVSSIPSYPVLMVQNQALKNGVCALENHIALTIKQANGCFSFDSLSFPESKTDDITNVLRSIQIVPSDFQNLPPLFFIFCMELLQTKCQTKCKTKKQEEEGNTNSETGFFSSLKCMVNRRSLMEVLKCAVSLWLAVLLGLTYSKESGFWAGLAIAIGHGSGREATFKVANVKAQGTALGSVYGVLCFFLFERYLSVRFLCLLPWFVFTSFLRRSRMYGPAGGISAMVGAVLILGRKDYGYPSEFAIARIVETFIGLSSSTMVNILLQPTRASKMAKSQLTVSFRALQKCINSLSFRSNEEDLEAKRKSLRTHVDDLRKFIEEAEIEPNFWFLPLHSRCYNKLFKSLSKMGDLFSFTAQAMKNIEQDSWRKLADQKVEDDLGKFKKMVDASLNFYADVTSLKSLRVLEKKVSSDIEMGKPEKSTETKRVFDEMEMEKMVHLFLQHSEEVIDHIDEDGDGNEDEKSHAVLNLAAIAFCFRGLMKEMQEIEEAIRELIQWENPSSHVNLNEISCKLYALQK